MKGSPTQDDSPLGADFPPSYDYALGQPPSEAEAGPGPSSSSATAAPAEGSGTIPKASLHLFNGPPNAEPLSGNLNSSLGEMGDIKVHTNGQRSESWDPKLGNGMSLACGTYFVY
jgi:hypothetical protein